MPVALTRLINEAACLIVPYTSDKMEALDCHYTACLDLEDDSLGGSANLTADSLGQPEA